MSAQCHCASNTTAARTTIESLALLPWLYKLYSTVYTYLRMPAKQLLRTPEHKVCQCCNDGLQSTRHCTIISECQQCGCCTCPKKVRLELYTCVQHQQRYVVIVSRRVQCDLQDGPGCCKMAQDGSRHATRGSKITRERIQKCRGHPKDAPQKPKTIQHLSKIVD